MKTRSANALRAGRIGAQGMRSWRHPCLRPPLRLLVGQVRRTLGDSGHRHCTFVTVSLPPDHPFWTSWLVILPVSVLSGLIVYLGAERLADPALLARRGPSWVKRRGAVGCAVSASAVGMLTAVLLNLVFRLGVRQTERLLVDPRAVDPPGIDAFLESRGAAWGARGDVIDRASFNLQQSIETIVEGCEPQ